MPSFGPFIFAGYGVGVGDEEPVSDTGWSRPKISADITLPLGAAQESVVTMGVGSPRRTIEMYLTPARFTILEALLNTQALLSDWEGIAGLVPTPDIRQALLIGCEIVEAITGTYGTATASRRVRLSFIAR